MRSLIHCSAARPSMSALWFKNRGTEPSFYWYVTAVAVIGFVATLVMPDNRVHGFLRDDAGEVVH